MLPSSHAFDTAFPALIRGAALALPIAAAWLLWLRRPPRDRERAAMLAASAWLLPALLAVNRLALQQGWWRFEAEGGMLWGIPVDLLIGWVLLWGVLPVLALPRTHPALLLLLCLGLDLLYMPRLEPVLLLGRAWWAGEASALALALLPALCLARWTQRERRLVGRALLLVGAFAGCFVWLIPSLALEADGRSWSALLAGPPWRISLRLQVLALPALLGLAAVQEFVQRGRGTPLPTDPPRLLVASGLYRYLRNPMQLALVLLWLLLAIVLRSPTLALAAGVAWAYCAGLAHWSESADMERRFGAAWNRYRRAVPAWFPRRGPWVAAADAAAAGTQGSHLPASLYLAASCSSCSQLAAWLTRREPVGLRLLAAEGYPGGGLRRLSYLSAPGAAPEQGIAALGRALEHLSLGWALVGTFLRLPFVSSLVQLIADALGAGPRSLPPPGAHLAS